MPELRKDPIVGRWVIIAHERAKRPHDFKSEAPRRRAIGGLPILRRTRRQDAARDPGLPRFRLEAKRPRLANPGRSQSVSQPSRSKAI